MEREDDTQTTESSSSGGSDGQESRPESKLRDLQPEKDPMGAGGKVIPGKTSL